MSALGQTASLQNTRNIGIIAHIDAGKTTTTERILYYTGRTYKIGEVHDGAATMDYMPQEQERGITITAAATTCFWKGTRFNIIDTPWPRRLHQLRCSVRCASSTAALWSSTVWPVLRPQSETVWRQADGYGVPRICFVNKMDRTGASFTRTLDMIVDRLAGNPVAIQLPIGAEQMFQGVIDLIENKAIYYLDDKGEEQEERDIPAEFAAAAAKARREMIEKVVETDDELMLTYLEDDRRNASPLKQIRKALRGRDN